MASKSDAVRKLRSDAAKLKRTGLASGFDARTLKPGTRETKRVRALLRKYDDVLSQKVAVIKLRAKASREAKKAGFAVVKRNGKNLVLVPVAATETLKRDRSGLGFTKVNRAGISQTSLFVPYHNIRQYLSDIKKRAKPLNQQLGDGESWGFQYHGNAGSAQYRSIDGLIRFLEKYESIQKAFRVRYAKPGDDVYKNLNIVRVDRSGHIVGGTQDGDYLPTPGEAKRARNKIRLKARKKR